MAMQVFPENEKETVRVCAQSLEHMYPPALRAFRCKVNDQAICKEEYGEGNDSKANREFIFRPDRTENTHRDEEREYEHEKIKQSYFHELHNSFGKK
jgi:hypothetical protein